LIVGMALITGVSPQFFLSSYYHAKH